MVSVPPTLPVQVLPRMVMLMPPTVVATEVPEAVPETDQCGGVAAVEVMLVQVELPVKVAAETTATPPVTVRVKLAVHGAGIPLTVAEVGPDRVTVPSPQVPVPAS